MATLLFIGFWVLLALIIVVAAMRGGRKGPMFDAQNRGSRRALGGVVILMLLIFGIGLPIVSSLDSAEEAKAGPNGIKLTAAEERGRELFSEACFQCHTLAASNAVAQVGPNLDMLRPQAPLIIDAVEKGRARGRGQMPAQLLEGEDVRDVAAYVERVAGR